VDANFRYWTEEFEDTKGVIRIRISNLSVACSNNEDQNCTRYACLQHYIIRNRWQEVT